MVHSLFTDLTHRNSVLSLSYLCLAFSSGLLTSGLDPKGLLTCHLTFIIFPCVFYAWLITLWHEHLLLDSKGRTSPQRWSFTPTAPVEFKGTVSCGVRFSPLWLKADLGPSERNSGCPFSLGTGYCQTHPSKTLIGRKKLTSADLFSFWLHSYVLSMENVFILHLQGAISVCPCSLLLYYDHVRNTFLAFLKISMLWKVLQNHWYRWQSLYDRRKEKLHSYNFFTAISTDKCCWQNSKNFSCS